MTTKLFDTLVGLENSLDYHLERHGVLSSNLANADTPGYRPQDVEFVDALQAASQPLRTDPQHLGSTDAVGSTGKRVTYDVPGGVDKNGVRLEQAMAQISANRVRYEAGIEVLRRRLAMLRYAAMDGSGGT